SGDSWNACSTRRRPRPCPRCRGSTTSSALGPATGSVMSTCAYPARPSAPAYRRTLRPGRSPPWRRWSMTCSESGRTPSASVARSTSRATSRTSVGSSRPTTSTRTPGASSLEGLVTRRRLGHGGHRLLGPSVGTRHHEPVADVAHGPDRGLVLGTQLGPQPADVDVDRARAAVVVVAPDLLQQLGAGEDPAGVLREELDQLELLEGQVEHPATHLRGVGGLVD